MGASGRTTLFGRDRELELIEAAVRRAHAGRLEVLVLEGEGGIGKSALVSHAILEDPSIASQTWVARFEEMDRAWSFHALAEALRRAPSPSRAGLPALATALRSARAAAPGSDSHHRVAEALVDLMEEALVEQSRVLVLEDVHWADVSSLFTIRIAVRRLAAMPMLIVATMRPLPRSDELRGLLSAFEAQGWDPLQVGPLDEAAVMAMVQQALGPIDPTDLRSTMNAAAGNPLFVLEIIHSVAPTGLAASPTSQSLRSAIVGRVTSLSQPSLDLLRVAAILGSGFSAPDLSVVAERSITDLMPHVMECIAARILEEDGERLRFRHELIRETLYSEIPSTVRKGVHVEAARRLAGAGAAPARVAEHFVLGAEPGDRVAVEAICRAAQEAAHAPGTRIELLRHARRLQRPNDPDAASTEAELADALMLGGLVDEAVDVAMPLLARAGDAALRRRLRLLVAKALRIGARWSELDDVTSAWLSQDLEEEERGLLLTLRASALRRLDRPLGDSATACEEALQIGERIRSDELQVAALIALEWVRRLEGRVQDGLVEAQRALAIVRESDRPELRAYHAHLWLGQSYMYNGLFSEAEATLLEGLRSRELAGTAWDVAAYHALLALLYERVGRWNEATVAAEASLDAPASLSNVDETSHGVLALIAMHQGRLPDAEAHIDAMARSRSGAQSGDDEQIRLRLAVLTEADDAVARIRHRFSAGARPDHELEPDALIDIVAFLKRAGEPDLATEVVRHYASPEICGGDAIAAACVDGAAAVLRDDLCAYDTAIQSLESLGTWSVALVAELAGAAYARRSDVEAARRHFDYAADWFDRLDANLLTARLHRTMRSSGIRRGARGPRDRPRVGWAALTSAERSVVDLAAAGLTNPQIADRLFVSRYTVQAQMKSIFQKLQITSRVELAARVSREAPGTVGW